MDTHFTNCYTISDALVSVKDLARRGCDRREIEATNLGWMGSR
jgi:hypothetical protein